MSGRNEPVPLNVGSSNTIFALTVPLGKENKDMSVANQKIVKIGKRVARDPAHLYAKMNIDAL